jgi:hypothetical protein
MYACGVTTPEHVHTQQATWQSAAADVGAAASFVSMQQSSAFLDPSFEQAFNLSSRPSSIRKLW